MLLGQWMALIGKVEIWSGVTDALTDSQTLRDRATQPLISISVELAIDCLCTVVPAAFY